MVIHFLSADVKTGEPLYEGNLLVENKKGQQKDYRLFFHEMIQGDGSDVHPKS